MADDERLLSVLLRFLIDGQSLAQVQAGTKSVAEALGDARREAQQLRREGRELGQVGSILTLAGAAMTAGISAAAALYIKNTKDATANTIAWKAATDSVTASTERIGAIAAQAVLPMLKDAAALAERVADFAEKNPEVVQTIFDIGKVVLTIGALVKIASEGIKFVADIKLLSLGLQQQLAASQMVSSGASHTAAAATMIEAAAGMQVAATTMANSRYGFQPGGAFTPATNFRPTSPFEPGGAPYGMSSNYNPNVPFQSGGSYGMSTNYQPSAGAVASEGAYGTPAGYTPMAAATGAAATGAAAGGLGAAAAALLPILAVTAAVIAVGKAFEMLNTEMIQPAQALTDVMHKHADSLILTADNYKAYQAEIDRTNGLYGTYRDALGQVHTVVKAVTEAEFEQARAEQGQAQAAKDDATAASHLTADMILFGRSIDDVKTSVGKALAVFKGMGTIGTGTQAGSDLLNQLQGTLSQQSPAVKAYSAFNQQMLTLQTTYDQQRLNAINTANSAEVASMATLYTTLTDLRSKLNVTIADETIKFNDQRASEQAKLNDELAKMAEQHATEMARLEQDHLVTRRKLSNSRDALGIEDEDARYALEVSRKNQDYSTSVADRQKQAAQTMADQQKAFDDQRSQQLAQYNQQVADAQLKYKTENDAAEADKQAKITALDNALTDQRRKLQSAFTDQLADLGVYFTDPQKAAYLAYYTQQNADLQTYIDQNKAIWQSALPGFQNTDTGGSPVPGHGAAGGGYASGIIRTGEAGEEWIMNNATTRAAEALLDGRLSQDRVLSALAGGGGGQGGGISVSLQMVNNFGGVTQPAAILDLIDQRAYSAVIRAATQAKQMMGRSA